MSKQQTPVTDLTCKPQSQGSATVTTEEYYYAQRGGNAAAQEALASATGEISESSDGSWMRIWGFGVSSSTLTGLHRTAIAEISKRNAAKGMYPTEFRGFASPEGGEDLNRTLAAERAISVSEAFPENSNRVVSCGEPSKSVDPSMYPYHRAVDVSFTGTTDLCEGVPDLVSDFLDYMPKVFRLGSVAEEKKARLETIREARAHYDRIHAHDRTLGPLVAVAPSNGMQDAMSGVADWVENGFDGEKDGVGSALPRAIVSPIPMFGAYVWGMYAGSWETGVNITDHARSAMGSKADRFTTDAEIQELQAEYDEAYATALQAFRDLEALRLEILNSGCSDDATLRLLAEEASLTFKP